MYFMIPHLVQKLNLLSSCHKIPAEVSGLLYNLTFLSESLYSRVQCIPSITVFILNKEVSVLTYMLHQQLG